MTDATLRPVAVLCASHAPAALATWWSLKNARLVATPSDAPCTACVQRAEGAVREAAAAEAMRAALLSPDLSHTRQIGTLVHAYRRDDTSPTGVYHTATCTAAWFDALAAELRGRVHAGSLSPLSPTEGR
jgi:hypothetical protein